MGAAQTETRAEVCPSHHGEKPVNKQCEVVPFDIQPGQPCGECATNEDCIEPGYHCTGPKPFGLRCVRNLECVQEGCKCDRKRDCCGQPFPDSSETDLRCRVPPFEHELHDMIERHRYCLPLETWEEGP
eukprot:CAMPEP_0194200436 /NCGR_PEP_ID=MMETSP0156-20130528/1044_1 /TAXON_ID=33649 /ORGANISM="Thalassionema nitzschioides, Strain L26-B" /LENGTH=128 /DNA_ID=CAMNT_0038925431 /DNA_START=145 /DNA_END=531 /DNA_ORIENTATION=-